MIGFFGPINMPSSLRRFEPIRFHARAARRGESPATLGGFWGGRRVGLAPV